MFPKKQKRRSVHLLPISETATNSATNSLSAYCLYSTRHLDFTDGQLEDLIGSLSLKQLLQRILHQAIGKHFRCVVGCGLLTLTSGKTVNELSLVIIITRKAEFRNLHRRFEELNYRDANGLAPKKGRRESLSRNIAKKASTASSNMADYESMTREELIQELVLAKINEARAKKGYEVKGVGAEKEYIVYDSRNTR